MCMHAANEWAHNNYFTMSTGDHNGKEQNSLGNVAGSSTFFFLPPVPHQRDYTSLEKHELQSVQYLQVWFKINKLLRSVKSVREYVILL